MIDINKLRKLAKAATPGRGWYVELGDYIYGEKDVTDGEEWQPVIVSTEDGEPVNFEGSVAAFIAVANPAAVLELLDRLEAAENDALEQARLNGIGAERELALMAKLEAAAKERDHEKWLWERAEDYSKAVEDQRDVLQAKITEMETQEPVAWLHESRRDSDVVTDAVKHVWGKAVVGALAAYSTPLYLSPGAQPAPIIPEGWKLVPIVSTDEMDSAGSNYCDGYLSAASAVWDAMLAAAPNERSESPEAKP